MDKRVGFGLLVALTIGAFIWGPLKHLRWGVVEYRRISYPKGKRLIRRDDPAKFYSYVVMEILSLIISLALAYWVIFIATAGER